MEKQIREFVNNLSSIKQLKHIYKVLCEVLADYEEEYSFNSVHEMAEQVKALEELKSQNVSNTANIVVYNDIAAYIDDEDETM